MYIDVDMEINIDMYIPIYSYIINICSCLIIFFYRK